jgi:methionyl-tRNA formyltransferase
MKIVFAGTPAIALPTLQALAKSEHEVVAVVTRPDAPVGRKAILTASDVAVWAEAHGIPVFKTSGVDAGVIDSICNLGAELGVVVAYGALLDQAALDALRYGWVNLHFSALPLLRGAAPVQWTLINQMPVAATTVFQLVRAMDAGDIGSTREVRILPDETAGELLQRLSVEGAGQTVDIVDSIAAGTQRFVSQQGAPTLAPKLTVADAQFDPHAPGEVSYAVFRGVTPEPGFWFLDGDLRVKLHEARLSTYSIAPGAIEVIDGRVLLGTASRAISLLTVQPAGRGRMSAEDWARGRR